MTMIRGLFGDVQRGQVRLVGCADVKEVLDSVRACAERAGTAERVVVCVWDRLPEPTAILDGSVTALARAALALWPSWYGGKIGSAAERVGEYPAEAFPAGVSSRWLEAAAARCRARKTPSLPKFTSSTQVAQLALAIEPGGFHLVLAHPRRSASPEHLLGLARAAEWLARESRTRVCVVVPRELAGSCALDSINFGAIDVSARESGPAQTTEEKRSLQVFPFYGSPHPDSQGEQLLADRIRRDAELKGLFQFNEPIRTSRDSRCVVDLVWKEGGVVVEVDGYYWHSDPVAFRQDRQRDYELLVSGFLVLRLTHDEILEDPELAVEKIRDVVAFRRRKS